MIGSLELRRYRCKRCRVIIAVVPPTVVPRRLYSRPAIAWALELFGVERLSSPAVAQHLQPWHRIGATAKRAWAQLRRWIRAVRGGALFPVVRRAPAGWSHRRVAELAARTIATQASVEHRELSIAAQVWTAASQPARWTAPAER